MHLENNSLKNPRSTNCSELNPFGQKPQINWNKNIWTHWLLFCAELHGGITFKRGKSLIIVSVNNSWPPDDSSAALSDLLKMAAPKVTCVTVTFSTWPPGQGSVSWLVQAPQTSVTHNKEKQYFSDSQPAAQGPLADHENWAGAMTDLNGEQELRHFKTKVKLPKKICRIPVSA